MLKYEAKDSKPYGQKNDCCVSSRQDGKRLLARLGLLCLALPRFLQEMMPPCGSRVFLDEVLKRSPVSALLPSSAAGERVRLAESQVSRDRLRAGKRGK